MADAGATETERALEAKTVRDAAARERSPRALLKKFTVSELYDVVLSVAAEVMTPQQFRRFVAALTKRLLG